MVPAIVDEPPVRGAARARRLWRLWRNERADPEPFYAMLADEAIRALEARHGDMGGLLVVDNATSHPEEMVDFVAQVRAAPGWRSVVVPVGKGELLAYKPSA